MVLNIPIPFEAIDIDHAPLAGSSSKGLFIARYNVRFAFNQRPSDDRLSGFILKSLQQVGEAFQSDTGSSTTTKSLPILNGCTSKSGPQKVLVRDVSLAEFRRVIRHVIDKILSD